MSILWTSLDLANGGVSVDLPDGSSAGFPAACRLFDPSLTGLPYAFYQYRADLNGLDPATTYSYRIQLDGRSLAPAPSSFKTAGPGACSFLVFGDTGEGTAEQRKLIDLMAAENGISFVIHTGDLAYPLGTYPLYESNYLGLNHPLMDHLSFFPTPGNHDYMADAGDAYVAIHAMPESGVDEADRGRYYSYDWGDIHFASVDTNLLPDDLRSARMLAWLENDLRSTRKYWKIVYQHHPPYPTGHHLADPICASARARINPIVEKYGVQLVIAGHEHGYERTMPLKSDQVVTAGSGAVYLISGGGGATLQNVGHQPQTAISLQVFHYVRVDVADGELTARAIGVDGAEIDRFTIRPTPVIAPRGVMIAGDYTQSVASGSLVSIFGQNLALQSIPNSGSTPPAELGGASIRIGGVPAPLFYVSPLQINAQIPYEVHGAVTVELSNQNGTATSVTTVQRTAPSILAVTTRDQLASAANAPAPGDAVVIYATGLGACQASPPPVAAIAPVDVYLDTVKVHPFFAGQSPAYTGLNQVNFLVPDGQAPGTCQLHIETPDGASRSVPLIVVSPAR